MGVGWRVDDELRRVWWSCANWRTPPPRRLSRLAWWARWACDVHHKMLASVIEIDGIDQKMGFTDTVARSLLFSISI